MTNPLTVLAPDRVAELLRGKGARLIDIRDPDEFARRRIQGAECQPLSSLAPGQFADTTQPVVFACRSGMRTAANADRLAAAAGGEAFILDGGLDAWEAAGHPTDQDPKAPLEIMRQVQIAAGLLILAGVGLALAVSPYFLILAGGVGAGLIFAGVTGLCGMARLLNAMPWNRPRIA